MQAEENLPPQSGAAYVIFKTYDWWTLDWVATHLCSYESFSESKMPGPLSKPAARPTGTATYWRECRLIQSLQQQIDDAERLSA